MPRSRASRGEPKRTSSPSTSTFPSSCWWTPERILIRVDFPAPLSPSRHMTSPAPTLMEMSCRAMTCPKYFETFCTSISGVEGAVSISGGLRRFLADKVVDQHGDEQHRAEEDLEPVGVDPGEEDSLAYHPEDERPEHRADDRTVAAREEHASDNGGDNGLELPELTPEHVGGASVEDRDRREQRRGDRGRHEEQNLHPAHRHADVARGDRVATGPEDPVPKSRAHQDPGR